MTDSESSKDEKEHLFDLAGKIMDQEVPVEWEDEFGALSFDEIEEEYPRED